MGRPAGTIPTSAQADTDRIRGMRHWEAVANDGKRHRTSELVNHSPFGTRSCSDFVTPSYSQLTRSTLSLTILPLTT